ncbi:uncharacterized protein LOC143465257 isoform X1 [Clavelina lepadiformis]|uniref:uncharacterized protein LOC143465257 isoform X1 n=1 Tax=Clavelina lepadiformis TaxID=159417 RepID=UPI0040431711
MPTTASPLKMSKLIGRLSQVQYVPIYDANRAKRRQQREIELHGNDSQGPASNPNRQQRDPYATYDFPSTYLGIRHPLPLPKVEATYDRSKLKQLAALKGDATHKGSRKMRKESASYDIPKLEEDIIKRSPRNQKLEKLMAIDTSNREPVATLHLPRIMKSFIPTVNRAGTNRAQGEGKSSWIDLMSNKAIKQVAPCTYKMASQKTNPLLSKVSVAEDETTTTKLFRRPLPPLQTTPSPTRSLQKSRTENVWHPGDSHQLRKFREKEKNAKLKETKLPHHVEDASNKALETLLEKLDSTRKLNLPGDSVKRSKQVTNPSNKGIWESSSNKPKILRSRRRKRTESDRHFGSMKTGVVFNKLPSDLMGNLQRNFQNLEYYLGRVDKRRGAVDKENVVHIPTGRIEDTPRWEEGSEVDEDAMDHYFLRRMTHQREKGNDVKIRYAHRSSNDTPTLDQMPWEDKDVVKPGRKVNFSVVQQPLKDPLKIEAKLKVVKRLTITMPKVPPPSPELQTGRPRSRGKRKRMTEFKDECKKCAAVVEKYQQSKVALKSMNPATNIPRETVLPDIPKEPVHSMTTFDSHINEGALKTAADFPKQEKAKTVNPDSTSSLADKLIVAHGAMKKRHKCPKKEVVIAPFKVSINDKAKDVPNRKVENRKPASSEYNMTQITKPFTFSYVQSVSSKDEARETAKTHQPSKKSNLEQLDVCNEAHKQYTQSFSGSALKPSYISNFVSVDQSKQIYQAINGKQEDVVASETISLDKATDCDAILAPMTPLGKVKPKRSDRVRVKLLPSRQKTEPTDEK